VKKKLFALCVLSLAFVFSACGLFPRRAVEIKWPEKIEYIQALCELDMAWKDMNYSGSMALKLDYPDMLQIEVYGPFGETIVYLKKAAGRFLLTAGDETFDDERAFEKKFDIKLIDFIDDLALRGVVGDHTPGLSVPRNGYRVSYDLGGRPGKICWAGHDGKICVKFLEARFEKE
jgi:hypothetical protein